MSEDMFLSKSFSSCNLPLETHRADIVTGRVHRRKLFMVGLVLLFNLDDWVQGVFLLFNVFHNLRKKSAGLSQ